MVLRQSHFAALAALPPATPSPLSPQLLSALPVTASVRLALVHISHEMSQTRVPKWREAVVAADEALNAAVGNHAHRFAPAAPVATGWVGVGRWLEGELVARQQAAAQGSLSMLQMRCDGARVRAEVRFAVWVSSLVTGAALLGCSACGKCCHMSPDSVCA